MKKLMMFLALGGFCVALLADAVTALADDVHPKLPPTVAMSPGAESGKHIFVMVRVGHGDDLPFVLDTGASVSVFDVSLASQLGKQVGTARNWRWGEQKESGVYAAPHFYLGGTRLVGGPIVGTTDFKDVSGTVGRPVMGLIGMDVLGNYCVQLDFAAGKVRFLDSDKADKSKWGTAVPLVNTGDGCMAVRENLAGTADTGSLIDTGDNSDGWLVPDTYRHWINQTNVPAAGEVRAPHAILAGEKINHLNLRLLDASTAASNDPHMGYNGIGLHTLSRYIVTFDFPNRTMYLKKPSAWSTFF